MSRSSCVAVAVFCVMSLAACASHRYTVVEPSSQPLSGFSVLEIREFASNLNSEESRELARIFPARLQERVRNYRERFPERRFFEEITLQTDQVKDVLQMDGAIISYEQGSRAKRYFLGLGSGKAYCTLQVTFRNKATGEELATTNFDGELWGGIFGGDADQTVDGVSEAFIDFLQEQVAEN